MLLHGHFLGKLHHVWLRLHLGHGLLHHLLLSRLHLGHGLLHHLLLNGLHLGLVHGDHYVLHAWLHLLQLEDALLHVDLRLLALHTHHDLSLRLTLHHGLLANLSWVVEVHCICQRTVGVVNELVKGLTSHDEAEQTPLTASKQQLKVQLNNIQLTIDS